MGDTEIALVNPPDLTKFSGKTNGKALSLSPSLLQHLHLVAVVALVQVLLVPILSFSRYLVAQDMM